MAHQNVKTRKVPPTASDSQPKPRNGSPPKAQTVSLTRSAILVAAGIAIGAGGLFGVQVLRSRATPPASPAVAARPTPAGYYDLLAMSPDELSKVDIALINLLCAKGLPGAESMDIPAILKQLDEWAAKVKFETERHLYRVKDPRYAEHYANSEARLRAEFIVQCLQEDCGVRYNPERTYEPDFRDARDMFIHGMLPGGKGGTCASMPVMYVAIGRRLGYPMKLVQAKEHLFCRWDGGKDRFNIEGSSNGNVNYDPDDYYRTWPKPISDAEMAGDIFLTSLTPTQELANFLHDRGTVLHANGKDTEARAAFAEAHRLEPRSANTLAALRATCGAIRPRGPRARDPDADAYLQQFMVPDPQPGKSLIPRPGPVPPGPPPPGGPPTGDPKIP
jgi:hypothetical protein